MYTIYIIVLYINALYSGLSKNKIIGEGAGVEA